jgi:uncharacterized membrane protein
VAEAVRMSRSRITRAAVAVAVVLLLAACAAKGNDLARVDARHVVGFWYGLWHGLISPITFLISLFNHHVNIYEVHNNGNWYNFGFMLGVSTAFSGGAHSAGASRRASWSRRDTHQQ